MPDSDSQAEQFLGTERSKLNSRTISSHSANQPATRHSTLKTKNSSPATKSSRDTTTLSPNSKSLASNTRLRSAPPFTRSWNPAPAGSTANLSSNTASKAPPASRSRCLSLGWSQRHAEQLRGASSYSLCSTAFRISANRRLPAAALFGILKAPRFIGTVERALAEQVGYIGREAKPPAPLRLLQDDPVAIWVFVRTATRLPERIEGRDLFEASVQHPRAYRVPLSWSRDVENQQVFGRR